MTIKIEPSLDIWEYFKGDITACLIASSIADRLAGYHISYSATELLKDLKLLTPKNKANKKAVKLMAHYLHWKYHGQQIGVVVIDPTLNSTRNPEGVEK